MRIDRKAKITDENREESRRLRAIWERTGHSGLSQAEFGDRYKIGSQAAVGFFLGGKSAISMKAAKGFSIGLNCSIGDFSDRLAAEAEGIRAAVNPGPSVAYANEPAPIAWKTTSTDLDAALQTLSGYLADVSESRRRSAVGLLTDLVHSPGDAQILGLLKTLLESQAFAQVQKKSA